MHACIQITQYTHTQASSFPLHPGGYQVVLDLYHSLSLHGAFNDAAYLPIAKTYVEVEEKIQMFAREKGPRRLLAKAIRAIAATLPFSRGGEGAWVEEKKRILLVDTLKNLVEAGV